MACKNMKAKVFARPEVRRELERFVFVELYADKPENAKLQLERFKSDSLPLYVILDADGKELARLDRAEFDVEKFLGFVRAPFGPDVRIASVTFDRPRVRSGAWVTMTVKLSVAPSDWTVQETNLELAGGKLGKVERAGATVTAAVQPAGPVKGTLKVRIAKGADTRDKTLDIAGTIEVYEPEIVLFSFKPKRAKARIGATMEFAADIDARPAGLGIVSASAAFDEPFEARGVRIEKGRVVVIVGVRDAAKAGEQEVRGRLTVRLEDGEERSVDLRGALTVLPRRAAGPGDDPLAKGLWFFLGLCIAGGAISLVMPCVYPLIPVTLTFFIKQSGGSRGKTSLLAFLYGLGIIVTFTALGFGLSVLLGAAGAQSFAANPWLNMGIAVLFFVMALSLLGMFELKLPSFITDRAAGAAPKQGYLGAFGLGLVFTIVTFTCTIPIAASLMAMASAGKAGWALLGMLVYSVTMAVPFLILGLFPQLIHKIPRSGGWLQTMKVGTGFLELALAFYYYAKADFSWGWDLLGRDMNLAIWIAILLAGALWLFGMWRLPHDERQEHVGYGRAMWGMLFATFAFFLVAGLAGRRLGGFESILPREKGKEYDTLDAGLEAAKKEKKLVFLEFTGFS